MHLMAVASEAFLSGFSKECVSSNEILVWEDSTHLLEQTAPAATNCCSARTGEL